MSTEAGFVAVYLVLLLAIVGVLELYGRQSTSAWASRVFTGYRRAVPDAPEPADPDDWPHSEVRRFHAVLSAFVAAVAVVLATVELVRHHRPAEMAVLSAIGLLYALLGARLLARLRRKPVHHPTGM